MPKQTETAELPPYVDRIDGTIPSHPYGIEAYQLVLHKQDGTQIERIFPSKEAADKWSAERLADMPKIDWAAERRWRDKYVCTRKD